MQVVNDATETKAWGKPPTNSSGQEGKQLDGHKLDKQLEVGSRGEHVLKKKKKPANKKKGEQHKADNDKYRKEKENTDTNKAKLDRKDVSEKHVGEGERQYDLEPPKKPAWKKDLNSAAKV
jgi:hypothetical protein